MSLPFFVSVPHSGERIAEETPWLNGLDETVLMCDPDRYVDQLYKPVIDELNLPSVVTEWHRYVVDLNRFPEDIDADSVQGSDNPSGTHPKGLHWSITTKGETLIPQPMPMATHQVLVEKYYQPFHDSVQKMFDEMKAAGAKTVYQLDCHSMPSKGEKLHRDPGEQRAEIVISDCSQKSCSQDYLEIVMSSYKEVGFEVAYNWPYLGGRITERYGQPANGQETIQVELNRRLYMDEQTKKKSEPGYSATSAKLTEAVKRVQEKLTDFVKSQPSR